MAAPHLILLAFCFFNFTYNLYAQQEEDKFLADQYYKKAKQLGDANVLDSSIYYYQKAIKIYEKTEDWRGYINCSNGLAACYTLLLDFVPAKEYLEKGFSKISLLNVENKMDSVIAENYFVSGFYYGKVGDFEKQFTAYQKALDIGSQVLEKNHSKVAEYYNNFGASLLYRGNYEKALLNFKKALEIYKNGHLYLLYVYNNLGTVYSKQGDYDNAISFFQKAVNIAVQDGSKPVEAALGYNNIGQVYEIKEDFDLARNYFQKALDALLSIFGGDNVYTGIITNNLAKLLLKQGKYDEALSNLTNAQKIFKENAGNDHPYLALTHVNIGQCYDKKGQYEKNLQHLKAALSIQQKVLSPNHPDFAVTLNNLGLCYDNMNETITSLNYYQQAMATLVPGFNNADFYVNPFLDESINSKLILLEVLKNKAKTLEKLYKEEPSGTKPLEHALLTYQDAVKLIDIIRFGFHSEGSQEDLVKNSFSVYEGAIRVANELYGITDEEKYWYQAFDSSQKSKAFLLLQAIKKAEGLRFADVPDSLIDKENELKVNVAFYERELHLARQKKDSAKISLYQDYLFQFNTEVDSLNRQLEKEYPKYYQLKYNNDLPGVTEIQQSILDEGTVLLEYFVGDITINIFCISKNKLQLFAYDKPEDFKSLVSDFKKSTANWDFINSHPTDADSLYIHSAHLLYKHLLQAPLASVSGPVKKLIVVPDGSLGYVNFEALLSALPAHPTNFRYNNLAYLIKSYQVHYLYSAATYFSAKSHLDGPTEDTFGGFAVTDASLPGAVEEVNGIANITNGRAWTGEQATERNFKENADKYTVLHLSMHGTLDDDHPLYSKLIFSQTQDSLQDDSLTVAEIYTMRLNAQMTVLSACETGNGPVSRGEGIMSMSRAFAYAGCPSVITSLWKVDAEHALVLMRDFYRHLLNGLPKDKALQQAKLNFLQSTDDPLQAHPHFWLSFIVTGDAAPVIFEENSWWTSRLSIYLAMLIVLVVFLFRKFSAPKPTVEA